MQALGDKVFCAGGDAKAIVTGLNKQNGHSLTGKFMRDQNTLDYLIGIYKIPYIALINGITMGGGAGLSLSVINVIFILHNTFYIKGIIALFIRKDKKPNWNQTIPKTVK